MSKYKVYFGESEHEVAPCDYIGYWYESQHNAQPIYLEIEAGEDAIIDYNSDIGNGVPPAVWHNRILRIPLPSRVYLHAEADDIIEEFSADIAALEESYEQRWNGQNHVGTWDYDLAEVLRVKLEQCPSTAWWDSEGVMSE